jgi:hypothetical protein
VNVWPATVSVPVRVAPVVLPDAVKLTVPFPVPDAPRVIVSQSAFEAAIQLHAAPAVTATLPTAPPAGMDTLAGAMANVHGAAVCVTVNVFPPIVNVPVRAAPLLAATLNVTLPFPEPEPPAVTVIQGTFDAAVHAHALPAVTVTVPVPPAGAVASLAGLMAYVHAAGASGCAMASVWPATTTVPLRAPPVFGRTVKLTLPLPVPLDAPAMVIQSARLVAVHLQALALASIVTVRVPPVAETVGFSALAVKRHGAGSCAIGTCVSLTTSIALRGAGSAFADTRYETDPLP